MPRSKGQRSPAPARSTPAAGRRFACLLFLLTLLSPYSAAAEGAPGATDPFFWQIVGVRRYFAWGWNLIPTGLDVTLGYRLPSWFEGVDTILQATIGGGYEGFGTFRDVDYTPHTVRTDVADSDGNLEFDSPNLQWQAGVRQGILWNPKTERNLLEVFLYYRGRCDRYLDGRHYWGSSDSQIAAIRAGHEAWQDAYTGSDAGGIFGTSLLAGLAFDAQGFDRRTKTRDGTYAELSFEASPYLASVPGASDFWRVSFSTSTFRTLHEVPPRGGRNVFAIYAGSYFSIDYADARRQMPLYVMQSFGGTDLRDGLADAVRGFEKHSWDTQLKIVHNFDLRINGPVIGSFGERDLLPGLVLYFDLGYGTSYWGDPSDTPGGFIGSTGIGLFLCLFDFTCAHLYAHVPVIGERLDGAPAVLDLAIRVHF